MQIIYKKLVDYGQGGGGGRKGGIYGESNIETNITVYKMDSQWKFAVHLGELKPGVCNNLEGWDGKEKGGRFKREEAYVHL